MSPVTFPGIVVQTKKLLGELTGLRPVEVTGLSRDDQGWHVRIGAPVRIERTGEMRTDVAALTRRMGAEFERAIAARPADWHMFQPGWEA